MCPPRWRPCWDTTHWGILAWAHWWVLPLASRMPRPIGPSTRTPSPLWPTHRVGQPAQWTLGCATGSRSTVRRMTSPPADPKGRVGPTCWHLAPAPGAPGWWQSQPQTQRYRPNRPGTLTTLFLGEHGASSWLLIKPDLSHHIKRRWSHKT